jgi:hypothetical protein
MATNPEEDDGVLNLTEDQQLDQDEPDDDQQDDDPAGGADGDDVEGGDDDGDPNVNDENDEETVVSFGDDAPELDQEGDSSTIRNLRRELREAKAKLREGAKPEPAKRELRAKPTSADHGYDDAAYEADLEKWFEEKAEVDQQNAQASERDAAIQRDWQADVAKFETQKAELKFDDLPDAQEAVSTALDLAQQAVLVKAAENPALLMYALGKSPAKLNEIAKIKDPIKLAAAIAKMEGTVKVQKRRKGPTIDTPQRGSGSIKSDDKRLAELEKKADATGDRTELVAYRRKLKAKANGKG